MDRQEAANGHVRNSTVLENVRRGMGKINPTIFNKHNPIETIHFQQSNMFQTLQGHQYSMSNTLAQLLKVFTVLLPYLKTFTINRNQV
jgi:hypothetical protein